MKLLLVDAHVVVRLGLRRLLSSLVPAEIHEASTAAEALADYSATRPDVVVLDFNLADTSGLDLLTELLALDRSARIVVFSEQSDPLYVTRALTAGARGYVSKSASSEELVAAVKRVMQGGRYIERDLATGLAFSVEDGKHSLEKLSTREAQIMSLLGEGKTLGEIAVTLGVAYKTITNTCSTLKDKLGVAHTSELIRIAIRLK